MSWLASAWAAQQKLDRPSDKLILLAYASCHNDETGFAYPSVAWLSEFSSLNRKTVIQCVARLEEMGLLTDTGKRVGSTKQVKVYAVEIGEITVPKRGPLKSPTFSDKESRFRDTEPVRNPNSVSKETSFVQKRASRKCPEDWKPTELDEAVGRQEGLDGPEVSRCLAMFKDHTFGASRVDWSASFRNWLRKAGDQKRRDGRFSGKPAMGPTRSSLESPNLSAESLARLEAIRNKRS